MKRHADLVALVSVVWLGVSAWPSAASAQPLGAFRWQLLPYCNVITLNVAAPGTVFTLDGYDDQCGAGPRASAVGSAFLNPDGTVGIGLTTVVAPGGAFVHIDARVSLASLGGPWRDSSGNSGTFAFTPAVGTGGPPRPVAPNGIAPGSITAGQLAPGAVNGTTIADGSVTTADVLDGPRAAFAEGADEVSLPGRLTIIQSIALTAPAAGRVIASFSATLEFTDRTIQEAGFCALGTNAAGSGPFGTWAWEGGIDSIARTPMALTRGFSVPAGAVTVYVHCLGNPTAFLSNRSLTALFVAGS